MLWCKAKILLETICKYIDKYKFQGLKLDSENNNKKYPKVLIAFQLSEEINHTLSTLPQALDVNHDNIKNTMDDLIDVIEPYIEIKFKCRKDSQKDLIEFILRFSNLHLKELAEVIEENILTLHQVLKGQNYLSKRSIINLVQVLYMFAQSCEFEN